MCRLPLAVAGLVLLLTACAADPSAPDAGVWWSIDGRVWAQSEDRALGGDGDQQMLDVAVHNGVLTAVGYSWIDERFDARVWTSPDGGSWTVVDDDDFKGGGWIVDIASTSLGLIGVGFDADPPNDDGAIWMSVDGVDWEPISSDAFQGRGRQQIWAVTEFEERLYAGGQRRGSSAIWWSEDGREWTTLTGENSLRGPEPGITVIRDLTVTDFGLLAAGAVDGDAAVWITTDGISWELQTDSDVFGGDGDQEISAVTQTNNGVVAIGTDWGAGQINFLGRGRVDEPLATAWVSDDGDSWRKVSLSGETDLDFEEGTGVGVWGDKVVAVGRIASSALLGSSFDDGEPAIWISADGSEWELIETASIRKPGWQDVFGIVDYEGTLVAVGGDDRGFTR